MTKHEAITPEIAYIRRLYAPEDRLLTQMREELASAGMDIHIGAEEGRLLQVLIHMHGVRSIVEVGTLAGYSAIWMARALTEGGRIVTLNKDPDHCAMARYYLSQCEVGNRITMLEGDAHLLLPMLRPQAPFDMIFIDADKISYPDYLDWAEENVRQGGLIVADNTLLFGAVCKPSAPADTPPATWDAMRRFNERLADPLRYYSVMIPTREGLSIAVKLF